MYVGSKVEKHKFKPLTYDDLLEDAKGDTRTPEEIERDKENYRSLVAGYNESQKRKENATSPQEAPGSRLSIEAVLDIRNNPESRTHVELAERYGISKGYVSLIRNGKRLSHVV